MKEIWIFGEGKTSDMSRWDINKFEVPGTCQVRYFSHAQMRANIARIEGFQRPSIIINVSEPYEELRDRQLACPRDHLINLY